MIEVGGIGWVTAREHGCAARGERTGSDDDGSLDRFFRDGLFAYPFKNHGRLDRASRLTAVGVALALRDAGLSYSAEEKQNIGIIGTSDEGSLASDLLYFKDYAECGRTLSRANLFIYTLPSSALGEAAIHFGLQGPLLYLTAERASLQAALETAEEMLELGEAEAMLAGAVNGQEALYFFLTRAGAGQPNRLGSAREARQKAAKGRTLGDVIQQFQRRQKGES
ncbi:MAG: hypothetical protein A2X56_08450 [Nitrospirae bacterium GWC2_57_13]|jgi:3-oxoacyl-[acyl-carrier-protein] synthase II|nr:MAG: hypothetical protein A2072_05080 [Nitrospirae bacterium GWC1_57_7]OGW29116.1 MAG: hypothetical protein A2X56_08450 [Nitrospirae bacterium GWC2_57_13]